MSQKIASSIERKAQKKPPYIVDLKLSWPDDKEKQTGEFYLLESRPQKGEWKKLGKFRSSTLAIKEAEKYVGHQGISWKVAEEEEAPAEEPQKA